MLLEHGFIRNGADRGCRRVVLLEGLKLIDEDVLRRRGVGNVGRPLAHQRGHALHLAVLRVGWIRGQVDTTDQKSAHRCNGAALRLLRGLQRDDGRFERC